MQTTTTPHAKGSGAMIFGFMCLGILFLYFVGSALMLSQPASSPAQTPAPAPALAGQTPSTATAAQRDAVCEAVSTLAREVALGRDTGTTRTQMEHYLRDRLTPQMPAYAIMQQAASWVLDGVYDTWLTEPPARIAHATFLWCTSQWP